MKNILLVMLASLGLGICCGVQAAERILLSNQGGNSCTGNYLDITAKAKPITVNALGLSLSPGTHRLRIFTKQGSYLGSELRSESWRKVSDFSIQSQGFDKFTRLDLSDFIVDSFETTGLMVVSSNTLFYSNSEDSEAYLENSDLAVYANDAVCGEPFSGSIPNRVLNGVVFYNEGFCFPLIVPNRQPSTDGNAKHLVAPICL
ncbi:hypothetical protein [Arenicella xantha]|uniref:Uncharacterized protein n=1 Tax=Arenicella xantha TaxID=644221 RepID=A0A395JMJ7_9GAMM|nr:hypothetical protein [Arenicella xantha]RBP52850.1 hypothetical protein DFR28_101234 [Arenicella xantha]